MPFLPVWRYLYEKSLILHLMYQRIHEAQTIPWIVIDSFRNSSELYTNPFLLLFLLAFQGVENIYTQHTPAILSIIENLGKGRLKDTEYPFSGDGNWRDKSSEIIIYIGKLMLARYPGALRAIYSCKTRTVCILSIRCDRPQHISLIRKASEIRGAGNRLQACTVYTFIYRRSIKLSFSSSSCFFSSQWVAQPTKKLDSYRSSTLTSSTWTAHHCRKWAGRSLSRWSLEAVRSSIAANS